MLRWALIVAAAAAVAGAASAARSSSAASTFYVDCGAGSDSNGDGSSGNPWKTLGKAQTAVRDLSGASATVWVAGDCYPVGASGQTDFTQPVLSLTSADSAAPGNTITWASNPAKPARLLAGMRMDAAGWKPAGGSFPAGVMVAPLPAGFPVNGSLAAGGLGTCVHDMAELFYGGQALLQARYPNVDPGTGKWNWLNIETVSNSTSGPFTVADNRALSWASELAGKKAGWAHGYWSFDWADSYVRMAAVTPYNSTSVTVTIDPTTPPLYGFIDKARWMGVNLLCELDAPGEYYLDGPAGLAYVYPPGPLVDGNPSTELWLSMGMVAIEGPTSGSSGSSGQAVASAGSSSASASRARGSLITGPLSKHDEAGITSVMPDSSALANVALVGFQVLYGRDTGISLPNVVNVTLSDITASCHGRHGLELAGLNGAIIGSTVTNTGCGASGVYGGDMNALTPGAMTVQDSVFGTYARIVRTYNPGIGWFGCVGCSFVNNTFYDSPHNGMLGAGNNNVFLNNTFQDLCYEATDSGAWYSGRSWIRRGNRVEGNTFQRILNREKMTLGWPSVQAVYLDDQLSGHSIMGNTFIDCMTGIVLGGGRDVQIEGNTFINTSMPVAIDNRGMNWQLGECTVNATYTGPLVQDLYSVHYTQPPYATNYPEITTTLSNHPCMPVNATIVNNRYCNATGGTFISEPANVTASWLDVVTGNAGFDC